MTDSNHDLFEQLVQRIHPGALLLRAWPLKGGLSADVTALEIEYSDGQRKTWVVRRHGDIDFNNNPHIAADEFKRLQFLWSVGIAAPTPVYLGSDELFGRPYLVVEYIDGAPEYAPTDLPDFIDQFAAALTHIHRADVSTLEPSILIDMDIQVTWWLGQWPMQLDASLDEGRIRDALEAAWPLTDLNKSGLLHGDFWQGNLIWKGGQLVGVIDWEDAARGDPLSDLGISRLEILWAFGAEAMEQFTNCYRSLMTDIDFAHLPFWDLWAALRPAGRIADWAGSEARECVMRQWHQQFVAQAFERLHR